MRKKLLALTLALPLALLLAVPVGLTGCKSVPTGNGTNTVSVLDPTIATNLAPILRSTVAGAVVYAYTKDTNSVKYIGLIQATLQQFILSTNLSPAALQVAIYKLDVPQLRTPEAALIITPILAAYAAFGQQYVQAGLAQQVGWKLLVQALVDGINDGLQGVAQISTPAAVAAPPK
jgi:hypothetical protein